MKLFSDNKIYKTGLLLVVINFLIYIATLALPEDGHIGIFFLNYLFTAAYGIYSLLLLLFSRKKFHLEILFPGGILALISAYSLNRVIPVFDGSPIWFSLVLIVGALAVVWLPTLKELPRLGQYISAFFIGVWCIVMLYLTIYLLPVYFFGAFAFFALGISLHVFVPVTLLLLTTLGFFRYTRENKNIRWAWGGGIVTILLVVTVFCVRWNQTVNQFNRIYRENLLENKSELPLWMKVAQQAPVNNMTANILKVNLTYRVPDLSTTLFSDFDFNRPQYNEKHIHHPLVVIADWMNSPVWLSRFERVKILESIYGGRHHATERLWSDEGIKTSFLNTSVQIWPQYRMAYTEQVIMLQNTREWNRAGEAIFTFHLPEGSVATSLSLWIDGKEEKAILTSKNKAEQAYRTIVGVESRDPSIIQWQEGSTLQVRVFPVSLANPRTFKIGITTPLLLQGDQLIYQPCWFEGTDYSQARESIRLELMQPATIIAAPSFLTTDGSDCFTAEEVRYRTDWQLLLKAPELSSTPFTFNGFHYALQPVQVNTSAIPTENIYLDLNKTWTEQEFHEICQFCSDKKIWYCSGKQWEQITPRNQTQVYKKISRFNFSLFPIHQIPNTGQALVISKSNGVSPNLSDLKETALLEQLQAYDPHQQPVRFFNLGTEITPYIRTLREFRMLEYTSGNINDLTEMLRQQVFTSRGTEDDNRIVIHDAGFYIYRTPATDTEPPTPTEHPAPDHLMRLFAYNHIMLQYAGSWNREDLLTEAIVREAQEAYVVSPVSSLIVLETQRDYDRFDIHDANNSLKNALLQSTGAAPEPHEWLLILCGGVIALYLGVKRKFF